MNKSLSSSDIFLALNGQCNILTYPELTKFNNINDVLTIEKPLILLYLTKERYGHWCCLIRHTINLIEFFDSYGTIIDDQLKKINKNFRIESKQLLPHLTKLLYNSGCLIEYNHTQLQKFDKNISTCGRWVVCRIWNKKLPLEEFIEKIKKEANNNNETLDEFITNFTNNL